MPDRMLRRDGTLMRRDEAQVVLRYLNAIESCSVVGISNIGKSAFLRMLCLPQFQAQRNDHNQEAIFVYVDCNRMLGLNDQGFYELVLRCLQDTLRQQAVAEPLLRTLRNAYEELINPHSPFHIPLSFNQGLTAALDAVGRPLVMVLDEFDEVLARVESRVFLNLRALKDQYRRTLVFVTATNENLPLLRRDEAVDEFIELFTHHTYYLPPLQPDDAADTIRQIANELNVTFSERDVNFVLDWAGGHIGLLEAACGVLASLTGAPQRDEAQDWIIHREAAQRLPRNLTVQTECAKIWAGLSEAERAALMDLAMPGGEAPLTVMNTLHAKHLLLGAEDDAPRLFSRLFAQFLAQQSTLVRPGVQGVRLNVESGVVTVDGRPTEALTNLEFRLLLLLYGQLGKICDKYQVVEAVWGQDYMDTVDDARIEKLVSRLRAKIEPDPANPRYLTTLRGRGYKLAGAA